MSKCNNRDQIWRMSWSLCPYNISNLSAVNQNLLPKTTKTILIFLLYLGVSCKNNFLSVIVNWYASIVESKFQALNGFLTFKAFLIAAHGSCFFLFLEDFRGWSPITSADGTKHPADNLELTLVRAKQNSEINYNEPRTEKMFHFGYILFLGISLCNI